MRCILITILTISLQVNKLRCHKVTDPPGSLALFPKAITQAHRDPFEEVVPVGPQINSGAFDFCSGNTIHTTSEPITRQSVDLWIWEEKGLSVCG